MDPKLSMYLGYLVLSFALTAWVSRSLFRNGAVFLADALGDARVLNAGFVAVTIRVDGLVPTPPTLNEPPPAEAW